VQIIVGNDANIRVAAREGVDPVDLGPPAEI
jgi:hypothetical protein